MRRPAHAKRQRSRIAEWLSRDPAGEEIGINLYRYVANDPIGLIDPLGLWQVTITAAAGYGVQINFGLNNGNFNFGAKVGIGEGLNFNYSGKCQDHPTSVGVGASLDEGIGKNASLGTDVESNTEFGHDGPQMVNGLSSSASENFGSGEQSAGQSETLGYESNYATGETTPIADTSTNFNVGETAFGGGGFNIDF
jgi:hypothetical protein